MNPLEEEIIGIIHNQGPIGVDQFMALALSHPRHGYYMTRDPFGLAGDFVTAPEISQIFGELLGLSAALIWQSLGEPAEIALVELGPGRGTLMADALRAAKAMPGFLDALNVHCVETSPVLSEMQAQTLHDSGKSPHWHASIDTLPADRPLIILANEFFDALPVRHFHKVADGWRERLVGLDADGTLALGLDPNVLPTMAIDAPEGAVFETSPVSLTIMRSLAERLVRQGGALLAIDYGHAVSGFGETLQAMRKHAFAPILENPGEADLTAHVDFAALAAAARRGGATVYPVLTQACLLERLGIRHRGEILKRKADNPAEIDAAIERLASPAPAAMGHLFKALAITSPGLAPPPGFDQPDPALAAKS